MNAAISIFCKTCTMPGLLRRLVLLACVLFVLTVGIPAQAQSPNPAAQQDSTTTANPPAQKTTAPESKPGDSAGQKPMSPQEARQAQIVADTDKLYQLAQELQAEVTKSGKNTLSLAVVKKAAEVEKLAKSLKERMKSE